MNEFERTALNMLLAYVSSTKSGEPPREPHEVRFRQLVGPPAPLRVCIGRKEAQRAGLRDPDQVAGALCWQIEAADGESLQLFEFRRYVRAFAGPDALWSWAVSPKGTAYVARKPRRMGTGPRAALLLNLSIGA